MRTEVAVGVIFDEQQRILITLRPFTQSHGGYWEFPGGKLEAGEEASEALAREIQEEIGITVVDSYPLGEVDYDYSESARVRLIVFGVSQFVGTPACLEKQLDMRWVSHSELSAYPFPEANLSIIRLIADANRIGLE